MVSDDSVGELVGEAPSCGFPSLLSAGFSEVGVLECYWPSALWLVLECPAAMLSSVIERCLHWPVHAGCEHQLSGDP